MKKLLTVITLLLISSFAYAQGFTIDAGGVKRLVTFVDYTEENVTVEWDLVQDDPATDNEQCIAENDPWECCTGEALGACTEPTADYYKVKLFHYERQVEIARGKVDHPGNQASLAFPYGGHYIILVTSCRNTEDPEADEDCSVKCTGEGEDRTCEEDWTSSDDASKAAVDGEAMGWWVYRYISPPTGGGIE